MASLTAVVTETEYRDNELWLHYQLSGFTQEEAQQGKRFRVSFGFDTENGLATTDPVVHEANWYGVSLGWWPLSTAIRFWDIDFEEVAE